ncbi:MAG: protein translocase subunit SecD [Lachnospiraceae bacterium]|nr:protein translocase subunit SecD [Lachnospiraceae bacterium]
MRNKKVGVFAILVILVLIGALGYGAIVGYGPKHNLSAKNIILGLDLNGGVSISYEAVGDKPTETEMKDTISKMQSRAEVYSTEASVVQEGDNRIVIDIPGVDNAEEVLATLGKEGELVFVMAEDVKSADATTATEETEDTATEDEATEADADSDKKDKKDKDKDKDASSEESSEEASSEEATSEEATEDAPADTSEGSKVSYDEDDIICTGANVISAQGEAIQSETGAREYVVSLEFDEEGTEKFAAASKEAYQNNRAAISIIYDHEVLSSPNVQSEITDGKCQISGNFNTVQEAEELASGIRIGALPVELKEVESKVVDAQLGQGALETGVKAGIVGFIIVVVFMIIFYRIPGFAASIALCMFLSIYLVLLNLLDVTLTLPGIAGVILNIGMAVDANVVIFSRIREELADGKTVSSAIKQGFSKALSAILDGNITTLIAALVLYLRGSGTVKGFAVTLAIGILISMFTALVVTRLLLNALCVLGVNNVKFFGVQKNAKTFDFVSKRGIFFGISGAMILACVVMLFVNKSSIGGILNFGLEFQGGTSYKVTFNDDIEINDDLKKDIEDIFRKEGNAKQVLLSKVRDSNTLQIQSSVLSEEERNAVTDKLASDYKVTTDDISYESISGSISHEMRTNAIVAVILAAIFMLIYIFLRFKDFMFASSAVLALLHDIIIVLLLYAVSRIAVGNTFIAVMLTILGYSINSTIVIFDRVRENLKGARRSPEKLKEVVNKSISNTLSRSINTNLTTFFMLLALCVFGVSTIREFAIPLMVGVLAGTYSSIFVTGPLWYTLKVAGISKKELEKEAAAAAKEEAQAQAKAKKAQKKIEAAEKAAENAAENVTEEATEAAPKKANNQPSNNNQASSKRNSGSKKNKKRKKGGR